MINIGTSKLYPWGWRLSLGLCMVPATTLLLGGIFLDDTPNSLCERGHPEKVCMMSLEDTPVMSLGPAAWAVIPITWPPQDCLDLVPNLGAECMHSSICKAALNTSYAPKKFKLGYC